VTQYIPIGTAFVDAQAILLAAGFSVEPYPDLTNGSNPNKAPDWYGVIAKISPFLSQFLSRTDLYVTLMPPSPGEYTEITKLEATFFVTMP
jgi:hypothetical protein